MMYIYVIYHKIQYISFECETHFLFFIFNLDNINLYVEKNVINFWMKMKNNDVGNGFGTWQLLFLFLIERREGGANHFKSCAVFFLISHKSQVNDSKSSLQLFPIYTFLSRPTTTAKSGLMLSEIGGFDQPIWTMGSNIVKLKFSQKTFLFSNTMREAFMSLAQQAGFMDIVGLSCFSGSCKEADGHCHDATTIFIDKWGNLSYDPSFQGPRTPGFTPSFHLKPQLKRNAKTFEVVDLMKSCERKMQITNLDNTLQSEEAMKLHLKPALAHFLHILSFNFHFLHSFFFHRGTCIESILDPHVAFSNIDHTSLTAVVKEKNLDQLRELGGVEGVADALKTDTKNGIHGAVEDVAERQETFGSNTYPRPPTKSFFYFHGLKEGWYDGGSIFVALSKVSNNIEVEVVRDGHRQKISIFEIVVGDVVCLKIGDQVPADGLFLDGHSLQVDESSMTGESDHVQVNSTQNPFLFSGTKVADGYAQMLVTSVGMNTIWGEMMSTISRNINEQTPLQARLNKLTSSIGKVGLAIAFLTKADDIVNAMVRIIAAAVTIVVVAIPEGLPLAVTLTLAYSMKKMMADQAMVRKLPACETMGSATTICTDKTGTLTLNQMKVTEATSGSEFEFSEKKRSGILMRKKADNKMHEEQEISEGCQRLTEDSLTLIGLVGIKDPCRPGVRKAVEDCQYAGVNVKMITGDNVFTARAIATELDKICVMARSSPFDKLLMVQCLKLKGHVVAVTGDGTNDAPALKEADIGLSMGIQGTEVPLTAVQLLWVNLIMDTLGALALATEQPTRELMEKPPVGRTEPLISNIIYTDYFLYSNFPLQSSIYSFIRFFLFFFILIHLGISFSPVRRYPSRKTWIPFSVVLFLQKSERGVGEGKDLVNGGKTLSKDAQIITCFSNEDVYESNHLLQDRSESHTSMDEERKKFGDGKSHAGWLLQWQRRVGRYSGYGCLCMETRQLCSFVVADCYWAVPNVIRKNDEITTNVPRDQKPFKPSKLRNDITKERSTLSSISTKLCPANSYFVSVCCYSFRILKTMSNKLDLSSVCMESLLEVPSTLSKPKRRWHLAFATIYCSRALYSLLNHPVNNKKRSKTLPTSPSSFVILNVKPQHGFSNFDQHSLTQIVKHKSLTQLLELGGVEGVAIVLETDAENGIHGAVEGVTCRRKAFGSNTYQEPPTKSFFYFGLKEGWYDGGSILVALSKVSNNIQVDVVRDGRRQQISIFEVVSDHVEVDTSLNPFFRDANEQTPLQARLNKLTSSIGKVGLAVAFLVLTVLLVRYFTGMNAVVRIIAAAVTIVVVAIPEGLPLAVTLTLAYSMKRMMADQAMVRRLSACETMGSATTICTDKTGTLTLNQMKVTKFWLGQDPIQENASSSIATDFSGTFNSEKKQSGVALRNKADNKVHVHWKGAAEMILEMCSTYYDASGSMRDLVNVKMITGDNIFTARAIATEFDKIRVMARSSPFDKLLMVQCLKQKGHVVAVTGDGTNDAPALKEADIGLSMGIQGTEVAKESSDIIILDDNFASVATVLRWGRCVYNNIQKFIQFQLTVNVAALVINFVAAVSAGEIPLTAVQLLWVNLIMDTLGALALATEQPTKELMEKPPMGRTEPLISNIMWRNLLAQALYQIAVLLTLQFKGESIFGVSKKIQRGWIGDNGLLETQPNMDIFLCKPTRIAERYLLLSRSLAISAGAVCEKKILMSHVVMLHGFECNVGVEYKYVYVVLHPPLSSHIPLLLVNISDLTWTHSRNRLNQISCMVHNKNLPLDFLPLQKAKNDHLKEKRTAMMSTRPPPNQSLSLFSPHHRYIPFCLSQSMSNIFHLNLNCKEPIPDVPTILSKPNKRWHLALHPLLNEKRKESSKLPVTTPSFVALNVKPDAFSSIDQTSLTAIVKEKNLDLLLEFGGVESVADALETDVKNGICGAVHDIALRQEVFGSNTYQTAKSLFHFVMEPFKDLTILILLLCATLSLGSGIKEHGLKEGWYDGGSIFAAVLLIISVSTLSNFRHNRLLEKLSKVSNNIKVDVVRNGRRQQISIFEIVVGDVVCLKISDQVPADGLFLDGHPLQVDESSMTGESDHVEVNSSQNPFLFSGTKVADGSAQMLVTSVGKLTSSTGKVGMAIAFLVLAVDMVNSVVRIIAAAVTIVVVAMPEGLSLAVTLILAYSMKRMMADQTMVRKLSACETMGSVTTICTDKTGTLTLNQMKVIKFSALNTSGSVYRATSGSKFELSGSPTEKAILSWAVLELDMDMEILKQTCTILHVEAFKSEKKRMTGDGTNDAPALKEAHIGLSMGIQGTEVAKESSDIIVLDDNFTSVATVLRWGRCFLWNASKVRMAWLGIYRYPFCILKRMSNNLDLSLVCMESLLEVPSTLSKPKKRWHLAFATIYCSRALYSLLNHPVSNNKKRSKTLLTSPPSFVILNVEPQHGFSNFDQHSLTQIVKHKSLTQLLELGGVEGVAIILETDVKNGIHGAVEDVTRRRKAFGSNAYRKPPTKSFFYFQGPKEGWYDGGSILVALSKVSDNIQVDVVRDGRRQQISIFEVVVGDVVCLKIGDQVPADGLFLDGHSLQVDESSMTGESDHVEVNTSLNPFLFSGTKVADGYARMVVTSVGMNTTWGEMMSTISRDTNEQTPLQARLNKLTSSIGKVGLAFHGNLTKADDVVNAVVRIIAVAVTIRMMAEQAMVRRLSACETMGSATTIYPIREDASSSIATNFSGKAFNSEKKRTAEMILAMCSTYYDASGSMRDLDHVERTTFEQIIQATQKLKEDSLTLIGLVGIKDPCRAGVRKAVEDCQYAGVNVKMITERMEKVDKIRVMARSSPLDKLLMVQCLKQKGHVVAVTGDGANDAPALKAADIGLSMGIQGTEVAKESSDIIILDDNFASVATVLRWGRCVYNNIQKFIQFQLTVNVAALVINFVAAVSAGEVPLTAVQLLWVNLIMDTLGALALATEQPTKELMEKPPMGRTEPLISNIMWRNLLAQALYQIAVLLTLQFKGESIFGVSEKVKDTLIFNTFVLCQVFNEFNARKLEKKNVVMVEFLKKFADTERLDWGQWGACIGIAAASWPIGWVVKCVPVSDKPFKLSKVVGISLQRYKLLFLSLGPHKCNM
ncbi:unnamed protein product, partial [Vitis vinifera]